MVKMTNALTGTLMYVDEARKEAYLAAGHKLADEKPAVPVEPEPQPPAAAEQDAKPAATVERPAAKGKAAPAKKR